jgi:hypothetical protein
MYQHRLRLLIPSLGLARSGLALRFAPGETVLRGLATSLRAVSTHVERGSRVVEQMPKDQRVVVLMLEDEPPSVIGPVASLLRGKYPDQDSVCKHNGKGVVELRTRNGSLVDFPRTMARIAAKIWLLTYGGYPSAVGASLACGDVAALVNALATELQFPRGGTPH